MLRFSHPNIYFLLFHFRSKNFFGALYVPQEFENCNYEMNEKVSYNRYKHTFLNDSATKKDYN